VVSVLDEYDEVGAEETEDVRPWYGNVQRGTQ